VSIIILLLLILLSLSLLKFWILPLLLYWEWVCCLWFGRVLIMYFICFVIIIFLLFTPRVVQHVPYLWMMCTNNARFASLFYTRSIAGYVSRAISMLIENRFRVVRSLCPQFGGSKRRNGNCRYLLFIRQVQRNTFSPSLN